MSTLLQQQYEDTLRENQRLRTLVAGFMDAAQVDALMSGPKLRGWNRSQLDRAYQAARDVGL